MIKITLSTILSLIVYTSFTQDIVSITDKRLPAEVKINIQKLNVDNISKFNFSRTENYSDSNLQNVSKKTDLFFKNGKLMGSIKTSISVSGYQAKVNTENVEICFIYCCIDKDNKEDCTTDYEEFKKKKKDSKCVNTSSKPCL